MIGFKAFNKDWKCRDFQYKVGETFEENGNIGICNKGLHYCQMPLDVLNYYDKDSVFAKVEALGDIKEDGDKAVTNKLKIDSELSFGELLKWHFKLIFEKVSTSKDLQQTSGYKAHSQTSGNYAHSQTSGYKAHSQTSGYKAHSQTSGDETHSQTSGNYAHSQTSGNYAHSQTSGDEAHSQTSGNYAIASSLGIKAKAKAENGWIIIVNWYQDDNYDWHIKEIYHAKVGNKILETEIKPNCWYWFEDGELKEENA